MAPLIHEFMCQAMANDLLPLEDVSNYTLRAIDCLPPPLTFGGCAGTNSGPRSAHTRIRRRSCRMRTRCGADVRHMHMREAIDKLMADFTDESFA
jgi:syntaxin-binding protein 1